MSCCEPEVRVESNRYGRWPMRVHTMDCPYTPAMPWRGDMTPRELQPAPETIPPHEAMNHWKRSPIDCDCSLCRWVNAHMDDDDDHRESLVDRSE